MTKKKFNYKAGFQKFADAQVWQAYDPSRFASLTHLLHSDFQLAGGSALWTPALSQYLDLLNNLSKIFKHPKINKVKKNINQ